MQSHHIKSLTLELIGNQPSVNKISEIKKKKLKSMSKRFWTQIKRLNSLKELNLQCSNYFNAEADEFIQNLNQSGFMLNRLEVFTVFLNHLKIGGTQESPNLDQIFPYITNLRVHEVFTSTFQYILNHIGELQNMSSLSLIRTIELPEDTQKRIDFTPMQLISNLSKLKIYEASILLPSVTCFDSFLTSFTLPKMIKSVTLNLFEIPWTPYISKFPNVDFKFENPFTNDSKCVQFYESWKNLQSLDFLGLCLTETDRSASNSLHFITPIFENLTRVNTIFFAQWHNMESGKRTAIDFGYMWKAIRHLNTTLENLYIEAYAVSLKNLELGDYQQVSLKNVGISGYVLDSSKINHLIKLFGADQYIREMKPHLELEKMVVDSEVELKEMMNSLKEIHHGFKLSLSMDIRKLTAKEFMNVIMELYRVQKSKIKNISLTFYSVKETEGTSFERLCSIICEQQLFGNVIIFNKEDEEIFNQEYYGEPEETNELMVEEDLDAIENSSHSIDHEDEEEFEDVFDGEFLLEDVSVSDNLDNIDDDF